MHAHTVTLTLQVRAECSADALALALDAAQHLLDTFNDDGSIAAPVRAEVGRPGTPRTVATDTATAAAVGDRLAQLLRLPRIRSGPMSGRYRLGASEAEITTPAALARTVAQIVAPHL